MGTAAAFLACYCPRVTLSSPGKPSDPGISSEFLPAQPGIQQGASRRSHVLMHVDPRDALMQYLHACHLPSGHPRPDTDTHAARQSPGQKQETDTRSRRGSGGYPARGSGANLFNGHERSTGGRPRRTARTTRMHLPAAAVPAPAPGQPRPADNPQPARGGRDPVFIRHGRAPKGHMEIYLSAHLTMVNGSALCAALAVTERD
jgi:hypothetical protein